MIDPELLRGVPSFAEVPAAGLQSLACEAREVEYGSGDRIIPLIKPPEQVFILLEGLVKLVGVSQSGNERIVYVFRPGEVLGSRVLLDVSPESAYESVAMQKVRALAVHKADFVRVAEEHPELLLAVTREFARRLGGLTTRMLAAMSEEVPIRLGQLLIDFASKDGREEDFVPLSYPLTHEAMAQIIGASRPHTSSVLGNLELQGVLRRRSDRGLLVCPARLERMIRGEEMTASLPAGPRKARRSESGWSP